MRWILCLTMLVTLGFAPAPVYKPSNNDKILAKLQGTWQCASYRSEGQDVRKVVTWKFWEGWLEIDHPAIESIGCEFLVDTARSPKVLELKGLGKVFRRVIFEVAGDTLTVCYEQGIGDRPDSFGGEQEGRILIVFEKRKDR